MSIFRIIGPLVALLMLKNIPYLPTVIFIGPSLLSFHAFIAFLKAWATLPRIQSKCFYWQIAQPFTVEDKFTRKSQYSNLKFKEGIISKMQLWV